MTVHNLLLESDGRSADQVRRLLLSADGSDSLREIFTVHRSTCLKGSLAVLDDRQIDVILIDDGAPNRSRLENIREIRALGYVTPIILCTDVAEDEFAGKAVRAGAQDCLAKDQITEKELIHCLLHAIERRQRITTEAALGHAREQHSRMGALQAHLLPQTSPEFPGYQIAGYSEPASLAGGDYFDYFELSGGNLGIAVADVSGHELASSLTMAGLRRCIRTCARLSLGIEDIMLQANHGVCEDVMQGQFVVALLAEIDPTENSIRYVTAGHRGYLIRKGNEILNLETATVPLGIFADQQFSVSHPTKLVSGDLFVAFTDGIWEAKSASRKQWGLDSVLDQIKADRQLPADEIVERLFAGMRNHCAPASHDDDAAVVVVKKL